MAKSSGSPERPLTVEDFLRGVLRSRLLDREELQNALRSVPAEQRDDADALADHLVRNGKLTRFQAGKLLRGVTQGLVMGPFHVLAPLGRGAMGTVFLARDGRTEQLVALKILPPRLARTEQRMLARFRREMELSQKVSHPHIAWTYDVGEYRGVPYIAMEYIPGKTLSRLVADEGRLPYARAARLMAEVASALAHAHTQGLIHRDLKPSNLLITPRDHAKVLDLGLAIIHGEDVEDPAVVGGQGYIVGTMDYIAPEQTYDAAGVDPRSDLYSLGCTLYFALTGQPPFPGGTSKEKIQRHRKGRPEPLARLVTDLPPGFVALVERLMARDPDARPATAALVEEELRRWSAGDADPGDDGAEAVSFDETTLMRQDGGSTDYSMVNLPPVEPATSEETAADEAAWLADATGGESVARRRQRWSLLLAVVVAVVFLGGVLLLVGLLTALF